MELKNYSSPRATVLCVDQEDVFTASTEIGVNWGDRWPKGNNENEQSMFE